MSEIDQQKPEGKGEVRIRSNVCADPYAWHLVPGDLVRSFSLPQHNLSPRQQSELMYYVRCCLCHKTDFEIEEEGCDYCFERGHETLSVAQATKRRQLRYSDGQMPPS